jgi:hypothetical protein
MATSTDTIFQVPQVPDKMEVIPIHSSDAMAFKRCRRYWDWASPMRHNLQKRADLWGVQFPLWFGTGIHWCLELYYDPRTGPDADPVASWKYWYNLQMKGGVIPADQLQMYYDPEPKLLPDGEYKVRGLLDLLPDMVLMEFEAEAEEHYELGIGMMEFYKEFAPAHDDFDVVLTEHLFSVPILDPSTGKPMRHIDPRDGEVKEVHYRGKQDGALVRHRESGSYGLLENKTAARIGEEYMAKLEMDEQCTRYLWASSQEARLYDWPYDEATFVVYNALRKAFPKPPTVLKNGYALSVDRENESTTADLFRAALDNDEATRIWFEGNEKAENYLAWLDEMGTDLFVQRDLVFRNKHEIESCNERIYYEALDMLSSPNIYPNPTNDWLCRKCQFRAPCLMKNDGSDFAQYIEDNYVGNPTR